MSTETIDSFVLMQIDGSPSTIVEVAPGVYERPGDQLLLGRCAVVTPYTQKHGKPHGSFCW